MSTAADARIAFFADDGGFAADFQAKGAEAFGQEIAIARATVRRGATAEAFVRFLLETAQTAYPANGFAPTTSFDYGRELDLGAR